MLRIRLFDAMKDAMRNNDKEKLSVVRMVLAAIKQKDIDSRTEGVQVEISDDQIVQVMQSMIKQRNESIAVYKKANRPELAEREEKEISVIFSFLPKQLDGEEIKEAITHAIHDTGAKSVKDMGMVMDALRKKYVGKMDFGKASSLLKDRLASL